MNPVTYIQDVTYAFDKDGKVISIKGARVQYFTDPDGVIPDTDKISVGPNPTTQEMTALVTGSGTTAEVAQLKSDLEAANSAFVTANAERDALKAERDALDLKINPPQFVLTARSLTAVLTALGKWDQAVAALNAVDSRIMPNLIQADRVDLTLPPADTLLPQLNLTKEEIMAHDLAVART